MDADVKVNEVFLIFLLNYTGHDSYKPYARASFKISMAQGPLVPGMYNILSPEYQIIVNRHHVVQTQKPRSLH